MNYASLTRFWLKHYVNKEYHLCSLCGNTGTIETQPKSPTGLQMSTQKNYCICPNGQAYRKARSEAGDTG
jgi:hypothetical protein